MKKNNIVQIAGLLSSMTSIYASETPSETLIREKALARQRADLQMSEAGSETARGIKTGAMGAVLGHVTQTTGELSQAIANVEYASSRMGTALENMKNALTNNGIRIANNYRNFSGRFFWPAMARFGQAAKWGSIAYFAYQPYALWYKSNEINKKLEKETTKLEARYNKSMQERQRQLDAGRWLPFNK
jgi:hypothetical protein